MACKNNEVNPPTEEIEVVPTPIGFPKMPVPLDNKLTEDRILLGKNCSLTNNFQVIKKYLVQVVIYKTMHLVIHLNLV